MGSTEKETGSSFWLKNPCVLLMDISFFPSKEMSKAEKLNALTRLAIVIAFIMYLMNYEHWLMFLVLAILILIVLYYCQGLTGKDEKTLKEDFTITPTYVGTDLQQTVVSPTFSEEWQIPPPAYDIYTQVPQDTTFEQPLQPQSYPYGQYLTRTNLLPSDEYYTHLGCGGPKTAREYVNSTFLRHDLARRENMTRIFKKSLNRRFRHNTQDTFSPYHSY